MTTPGQRMDDHDTAETGLTEPDREDLDPERFSVSDDPYAMLDRHDDSSTLEDVTGGTGVVAGLAGAGLVFGWQLFPESVNAFVSSDPGAAATIGVATTSAVGGGSGLYHGIRREQHQERLSQYIRLTDVDTEAEGYIQDRLAAADQVGRLEPEVPDDRTGTMDRLAASAGDAFDRLRGETPSIAEPRVEDGTTMAEEYGSLVAEADETEYLLRFSGEDRYELWVFAGDEATDGGEEYAPTVFTGYDREMAGVLDQVGVDLPREHGPSDSKTDSVDAVYGELLGR